MNEPVIRQKAHALAVEFVGTSRRDVTYEEAIDMLLAMATFCGVELPEQYEKLKNENKNLSKQLYCSDQNQKKEHGKLLNQIALFRGEVNRRKKVERELKELQSKIQCITLKTE